MVVEVGLWEVCVVHLGEHCRWSRGSSRVLGGSPEGFLVGFPFQRKGLFSLETKVLGTE